MNNKRVIGIIVTAIWVVVTIIFLKIDNNSNYMKSIIVNNSKKIYYEKLYFPIALVDNHYSLNIYSNDNMCNEYIEKGIVKFKYIYNKKIYYNLDNYRSFKIYNKTKGNDSIKIILEVKNDIKKCKFNILIYPGKLNLFVKAILFFFIPLILILANVILPIFGYIYMRLKIKWHNNKHIN